MEQKCKADEKISLNDESEPLCFRKIEMRSSTSLQQTIRSYDLLCNSFVNGSNRDDKFSATASDTRVVELFKLFSKLRSGAIEVDMLLTF